MTLDDLETIIRSRAQASSDESWTAKLLSKGPEKVAEKFGEEAIECLIEAVRGDKERLTSEAADVLYHLLVMLHARGVSIHAVLAELDRRQTQSGLAEKSSRPPQT
ncbi:MAG: phosphoribosyl-ATP diphosphatase [Pseudomonadota bacterium]